MHPSSDALIERVAHIFQNKKILATRSRYIAFLCGGSVKSRARSMRKRFIKYAKHNLPSVRIFLAENAQTDISEHSDPELINVAEFEELIASISDCIIIFPESPGSYAELGYFAKHERIRESLLVVNDENLQSEDSFINNGPIRMIDEFSAFQPVILLSFKGGDPDFNHIVQRLRNRFPSRYRKSFEFGPWNLFSNKVKMFLIFEIVRMFRILNVESIKYILEKIFGQIEDVELKRLISILVASMHFERLGDDKQFFATSKSAEPFFEFDNFNITTLWLDVNLHFKKHAPICYELCRSLPE